MKFDFEKMDFSEIEEEDLCFTDTEAESEPWSNYHVNPFEDS